MNPQIAIFRRQIFPFKKLEGKAGQYRPLEIKIGPSGVINPRKILLEKQGFDGTVTNVDPVICNVIVDGKSVFSLLTMVPWYTFADNIYNDYKLPVIQQYVQIWIKFFDSSIINGKILGSKIR